MCLLGAHFLLLSISILLRPSFAAPQPQPQSQASLNDLKSLNIPKCALQCFIDALSNDGCNSETDFSCHCTDGKVLSSATSCVDKTCSASDKNTAFAQIRAGCKAVGVSISEGEGASPSPSTSALRPASSQAGGNRPPSSQTQTPSTTLSPTNARPGDGSENQSRSNPTNTKSGPTPPPFTSSATPSPTETPLALTPTSHPLSTPAKAGISVSVTLVFSALLLFITLYIRRLKRDLRVAQAAAGIPESVWRAHVSTAAAAAAGGGSVGASRRKSWLGRRSGEWPISPLSEGGTGAGGWGNADTGGMGGWAQGEGGVKKKRGHVLSVVVERAEEDESTTSTLQNHNRHSNSPNSDSESTHHIIPREPVPGQKEGLADALELDGEGTLVVEAPTSITPKGGGTPNRGRSRERGGSFGEAGPSEFGGFDFGERGRFG